MTKRKRGEDDPRDLPASAYDRTLFQINMPLIVEKKLKSAPIEINKFYGGILKPEIVQFIQRDLIDPAVHKVARTFTGTGEMSTRITLASMAPAIKDLIFSETEKIIVNTKKDDVAPEDEQGDEESPGDVGIEPADPSTSPGSARDMAACHQDRKVLQDNQAVDIVYNVVDKEISQNDAYNIEDAECAALVVDGKGRRLKANWLKRDSWQVKSYTYYYARNNLVKGRCSAVSFACVSEDEWASGVIVPESLVNLEEGGVLTEAALQDAKALQTKTWEHRFGKGTPIPKEDQISRTSIESRIRSSTTLLRAEFGNDKSKSATLLHGLYLIGTAYTGQKVHSTRKYPLTKGEPPSLAALAFLEGVLRSVLGERVQHLRDIDQIKGIIKRNRDRARKEIEESYTTHDAEKVNAIWGTVGGSFV